MLLGDFRATHLPYCLEKQADGSYVVLNGRHRPLGFTSDKRVKYGDYPIAVKIRGLTAKTAARVSWNRSMDVNKIYLYNDGCIPTKTAKNMRDYLGRLAILSKSKVGRHIH